MKKLKFTTVNYREGLRERLKDPAHAYQLIEELALENAKLRRSGEGVITRERYRQMKLINKRRWEQIQQLEIENDKLKTHQEKEFHRGACLAAAWLVKAHGEDTLAKEFLHTIGVNQLKDLKPYDIDEYDLEALRRILRDKP